MSEELKPCPFCGSSDVGVQNLIDEDDNYVSCNSCEAQQVAKYTRDGAIKAWNRRVGDQRMHRALALAEGFIEEELVVRKQSFLPDKSPYIDEAATLLSVVSGALGRGETPRSVTSVVSEIEALREYIQKERDFNEGWIALHIRDGHPGTSERRKEIVAERDKWLCALDEVIGNR